MADKVLNSRIVHKHDVEENWLKAVNFIPKKGELIVYDIDATYNYERFKIGDGVTLVSDLPFSDDHLMDLIQVSDEVAQSYLASENKIGLMVENAISGLNVDKWEIVPVTLGCASNGEILVCASANNGISFTSDLRTWNIYPDAAAPVDLTETPTTDISWEHVVYGNGIFLVFASHGNKYLYSTNGTTWTQRTLSAYGDWSACTYGNGKFVIAKNGSDVVFYSTDGLNWTQSTSSSSSSWKSMAYGNGKYVMVTQSGIVAYSSDAITWEQTTLENRQFGKIVFGNGVFVAGTNASSVVYSTDGITWTEVALPCESMYSWATAFNDSMFLLCGYGSKYVACSSDGMNWKTYELDRVIYPECATNIGDRFFFGGYNSTYPAAFVSVDGIFAKHIHDHNDLYYTEDEIDDIISSITSGSIAVEKANEATHADSADSATSAGSATKATQDASGNVITSTYETKVDSQTKLDTAKEYTDTKTANLASTTVVDNKISAHNTSTSAHSDIRELITDLTTKLNNFLNVDDTTTDQLSEVLQLINNNKGTLESLTTSKINVSDIVDNLTTSSASKVLSAKQGAAIKELIDDLQSELDSHTHSISDVTNLQSTLNEKATQTALDTHDSNTTKHITSTERTNWNAAKTHAGSAHAPSNAEKNQNAFSNIAVSGQTTVAADTATDTVTFAGSNVSITTDANNDKVTFSVADGSTSTKGIVQLTNSTSSTSTTTAATPSSVKSAYDLANTAKINASTAQTRADSAYSLAESKVDSLSDLGITATAAELNYMDGVTSNVQTQLDAISYGKQDVLTGTQGQIVGFDSSGNAVAIDNSQSGGSVDWEDINNKPNVLVINGADTITWDGVTDGLYYFTYSSFNLYRVMDYVGPPSCDVATISTNGGSEQGFEVNKLDDGYWNVGGLYCMGIPYDNYVLGDCTIEKSGTYLISLGEIYISEVATIDSTGFYEKISEKYLPHSLKNCVTVDYSGTLTWDGVIYCTSTGVDLQVGYGIKISDVVLTKDDVVNGVEVLLSSDSESTAIDGTTAQSYFEEDGYACINNAVFVVPYDNYVKKDESLGINVCMFPTAGTYFVYSDDLYTAQFKVLDYNGFNTKINSKLMPYTYGTTEPEVGVTPLANGCLYFVYEDEE